MAIQKFFQMRLLILAAGAKSARQADIDDLAKEIGCICAYTGLLALAEI